jgi:hypothetical protein
MARRGRTRNPHRVWPFPAAGLALAVVLAVVPAQPFWVGGWPMKGPFGAFTWGASLFSLGLAFTLLLLAIALWVRRSRGSGPVVRRVLTAASGFGLLALAAFASAERGDLIERNPALALALALLAVVALRALVLRASRPPAPATAASPLIESPAPPAIAPGAARLSRLSVLLVVAGCVLGVVVLFFACGAVVRLVGPGVGTELTVRRPAPFFWGESAYFDYAARRAAGADVSDYLRPPPGGDGKAVRHAVLPAGAKIVIKGWLDGGAEVKVCHDPGGHLLGEWGYVYLRDLDVAE